MARINIEDEFWIEVAGLVAALGDQDRAIGQAVRFFRFAQDKHKKGKLITEDEFARAGFHESLIPTFAKRTPSGIQALGAEKHFGWLKQKKEAGSAGGKKSAQRPRDPKGRLVKKADQNSPSEVQAQPSIIQPSYSSSYSSSDSHSPSSLVAVDPASGAPPPKNPELNKKIWKAYKDSYLARYHKDPVRNAKVNGQVAQLGSRLGEEAVDVVAFYLTSNKTFYVAKCHDLGLCLADAEALHTQWFHGKAITNADLKRFEKTVESNNLDQLINEGKI